MAPSWHMRRHLRRDDAAGWAPTPVPGTNTQSDPHASPTGRRLAHAGDQLQDARGVERAHRAVAGHVAGDLLVGVNLRRPTTACSTQVASSALTHR